MKRKLNVIALVICLTMLFSACQATVNLPAPTTAPEASPADAAPSAPPAEAASATSAPTTAPIVPAPVDETTYRAFEEPLAAILAADSYQLFNPGQDATKVYNTSVTAQYAASFLYLIANAAYDDGALPNPAIELSGYTSFVAFSAEQLKDLFDLVFYSRLTVDDFAAADLGPSGVAMKGGVCYVGMGDPEPETDVKFLRVNDDGTISYSFELGDEQSQTKGVLSIALATTTDTRYGVYMKSYTVDAAATETPVAQFVEEMRALLDEKKVEYELLGPGGSTFSNMVGNPTFANLDYFWLDAATRVHSDYGEIESISLKFNKPIDETGKAILLCCIQSLSRFATMEQLEAALPKLKTEGQAFVGSCILQLSGDGYWLNLPDSEIAG